MEDRRYGKTAKWSSKQIPSSWLEAGLNTPDFSQNDNFSFKMSRTGLSVLFFIRLIICVLPYGVHSGPCFVIYDENKRFVSLNQHLLKMENNDAKTQREDILTMNRIEEARKEGQSKGVLITAIIGLAVLLGLGLLGWSLYRKDHNKQLTLMENQRVSFSRQLSERDSTLNDWLTSFDEIEKNLRMIKEKEKLITVNSAGSEVSADKRQQIMEDIKTINTLLDENRKKIASLNAQLKQSGITITGLQTRVAELETSMKNYENDIAILKANLDNKDFEIEQLNETMVALNDTLNRKVETINTQTYMLNQAFLVSGTYKDLRDKGILYKEGGFLGIGRQESIKDNFDESIFTEVNISELKSIPVNNSRKVKLVTEHPAGSYELVKENENTISSIAILDPGEFWKISRYAVVELVK